MLITVAIHCLKTYFFLSLIALLCTGYVTRVNARRAADDPEKKDYPPTAVALTLLWPLYAAAWFVLFILKALAYGGLLVLFTAAFIVIRKPFLFLWLESMATKMGRMFLRINTFLIRTLFRSGEPGLI